MAIGTDKKSSSFMDFLTNKKQKAHYFSERAIRANEDRLDYPTNAISTGKYNVITFLPKNLFFQFSKLANVYFVVIGLLQMIKVISTSKGVPYVYLPLAVIIAVTMLKDIVEDYARHKSDKEENTKPVKVFKNGQFVATKWQDIRVGNIVRVEEDQFFPADLLLLKSSGKKGVCFVETKNLDGETNLKQKQAHKDIAFDFENNEKMATANNFFKYEKANDYLYKFVGSIETSAGPVSLGEQNLVLRGSNLKNTEYIIGLVAYSGHHTKIMLNSIKSKPKFSRLEKTMSRLILIVFAVQLSFCLFGALYAAIWYSVNSSDVPYLLIDTTSSKDNAFAYNLFVRFGNWLLLLNGMVPISLLVTLEMVKVFQGIKMIFDPDMTAKASGIKTTVQSSNLNEELGQVDYIFSDKTGTLTQNLMEFKNLSVKLKSYGDVRNLKDTTGMPKVSNVDFFDKDFLDELNNPKSSNHDNIIECLTMLAVCHTTMTEEKDGQIIYNASSPDELALVNFAKFVGAEFIGLDDNNNITINLKGKVLKFQLLHVLEFNSTRKRMSVIVKAPDGKLVLYTKGADSIILERMNKADSAIDTTQEHLNKYASIGLRTLLLAKRVLDPNQYTNWAKRYHDASIKIDGRDEAMEVLQSEIEQDLRLVGATAIEDKLQDEVDTTISKIREAGIKIWVLTGDKVETAINIGYSCKLLDDSLIQLQVTEKTLEEVRASLDEKIDIIQRGKDKEKDYALIISGDALVHAMKPELSKKIMTLGEACKSVLACRVSPKQKQEIVSLVRREKPKANTLAIGDGANDVFMITAANVGIGIRGVEGQQAARASDFAIGEFKILRRLLYVHGREAYRKNSYLILYNFYKNSLLLLPQFWLGFLSCFSGVFIFEQFTFQFYNIFFTSLPIIIYAVFDQEYKSDVLMNSPKLYIQGMQNEVFNTLKFLKWLGMGIWESAVIGVVAFGSLDNMFSAGSDGRSLGLSGQGMLSFSAAIFAANFKILGMSNTFSVLNVFVVFASMAVYVIIFFILNLLSFSNIYDFFTSFFSASNFYIGMVLAIGTSTAFFTAANRWTHLVELYDQKKINPVEIEVQQLLDAAADSQYHLKPSAISSPGSKEDKDRTSSEIELAAFSKTKRHNDIFNSPKKY